MEQAAQAARRNIGGCIGSNLRRANRILTQFYDDSLRPSGLRVTQFSLLARVMEMGRPTMNHLADAAMMDRTTLTRNLKPLLQQGLVAIQTGKDRRSREITLTAEGGKALLRALPFWKQAQTAMLAGLGERRAKRLLGDLAVAIQVAQQS